MAKYYPLTLLPTTWTPVQDPSQLSIPELDPSKGVGAEHADTWIFFPEEIKQSLKEVIKPYGYATDDNDQRPNVRSMLGRVEKAIRHQFDSIPWAIVFYPQEYPLSGHLLSIRPSDEIRFSAYSVIHPDRNAYDPSVQGAPPLSLLWIFTKNAMVKAAEINSPLITGVFETLKDAPEDGHWTMLADPIDPDWVTQAEKSNAELFFESIKQQKRG
ncbi:MAG: hypothetical protein AB1664_12305 [Thermodesulfobacteriota bacterium]